MDYQTARDWKPLERAAPDTSTKRAIEAGLVERPMTYISDMDDDPAKRKVLWAWDHRECLDIEKE